MQNRTDRQKARREFRPSTRALGLRNNLYKNIPKDVRLEPNIIMNVPNYLMGTPFNYNKHYCICSGVRIYNKLYLSLTNH